MEVDQGEQINSDAGVVAAAACHRVDESVVVFVAGWAIAIDDQVFVRIDIREDSRYFVWAIGWCLGVLG
jgi:esterase/lipase superfamily enzyme